jgi:hypothetical protein
MRLELYAVDFFESNPKRLKNFFSKLKYVKNSSVSLKYRLAMIEDYFLVAKKSGQYDPLTLRTMERQLEKIRKKIKDLSP